MIVSLRNPDLYTTQTGGIMKNVCIFTFLLVALFFSASLANAKNYEAVSVSIGFDPLPAQVPFDSTNAQFLTSGDSIDYMVTFADDSSVSDMKVIHAIVPDAPGYYIFWVRGRDTLTGELIQKFCQQHHVCVIKVTERPYLFPASPNPTNAKTIIAFFIPQPATVSVDVLNVLGDIKAPLLTKIYLHAGMHALQYSCDSSSAGLYFCVLTVDSRVVDTRKFFVLK